MINIITCLLHGHQVPCRTATRGSFPLDGTYFQINEVFADDDTSEKPLVIPRKLLSDLDVKTLYCRTSISTIFQGLSTQEVRDCFWEGYVCIRGFSMKTREPRSLHQQFHRTLLSANRKGKSPRQQIKEDGKIKNS
ncbi:Protein ROS1 [Artemisia annua]|uniref:Protein ROS1 n=1 Tax=Artemisia annua TaxID=35608 RepID=A0A2U1KN61_ARTAN|nr:Protein ROS1 [Artemisia annua]